jgi:hypothetical protein
MNTTEMTQDTHERVGPPVPLLVLAFASVLLSGALLISGGFAASLAGYLLGSIVTVALVGLFHQIDLQRRQSPFYVQQLLLTRAAGVIAALGVVVAAAHAWSIATELAK